MSNGPPPQPPLHSGLDQAITSPRSLHRPVTQTAPHGKQQALANHETVSDKPLVMEAATHLTSCNLSTATAPPQATDGIALKSRIMHGSTLKTT